jgi:heptosyltransferase-3
VIHPASRWRFKCWPMDRVIRAADELGRQGWSLVITTSPDPVEIAMAAEIERGVKHARLLNLAGKTGVAELAALLGVSRGLLTVDSLPLHMASALRTPVVALFGPSSDATWGPWMHARSRVVTQDYSCRPCQRDGCAGSKVSDCLMQLPETAVLQALREVVGQPGSY